MIVYILRIEIFIHFVNPFSLKRCESGCWWRKNYPRKNSLTTGCGFLKLVWWTHGISFQGFWNQLFFERHFKPTRKCNTLTKMYIFFRISLNFNKIVIKYSNINMEFDILSLMFYLLWFYVLVIEYDFVSKKCLLTYFSHLSFFNASVVKFSALHFHSFEKCYDV